MTHSTLLSAHAPPLEVIGGKLVPASDCGDPWAYGEELHKEGQFRSLHPQFWARLKTALFRVDTRAS